jgi:multisubunit Na+/H+ antiporter MnhF subunit
VTVCFTTKIVLAIISYITSIGFSKSYN